ncbi:MAG: hypothetical protein HUJ98_00885 [Bacteroidaceae bacterium]|nr:hypothetical protein [Bacteroidaceae bacterium]
MQQQCISNNDFMAFPCMNYSFYTIDKNDYSFKQALTLDFGNKLSIDDYNDIDGIANRRRFLLECSKSLPLRTFRSDNYMASVVKEGQLREDLHLLILNLDSRRSTIVVSDQDGISLPIMDYFEDKTFYSFVTSDEISEYVKENLLDEKSKQIYTSISDSSNYCLLKYHFKDVL